MLDPVSVALKFGFLIVLYLFVMWVAWSSVRDLRRSGASAAGRSSVAPVDPTGMYEAAAGLADPVLDGRPPRLLVDHAAGQQPGSAYDLSHGATLGRGNVEIKLDDPFASALHARVSRQGHVFVIEDLGSTNGTYLNDERLTGPAPLRPGDRIRIGDSEFSYRQ